MSLFRGLVTTVSLGNETATGGRWPVACETMLISCTIDNAQRDPAGSDWPAQSRDTLPPNAKVTACRNYARPNTGLLLCVRGNPLFHGPPPLRPLFAGDESGRDDHRC
ncbi:hypothetical protein J6590_017703 [Homalodisca vitripennis]|nr:hypothetical protein J6590_017703 [Homalodisca vitripennis]